LKLPKIVVEVFGVGDDENLNRIEPKKGTAAAPSISSL
jgi:hypothetical protein